MLRMESMHICWGMLKRIGKGGYIMRFLVTGGTGFIGSYLVMDLVTKGEKVVIYDISPNLQAVKEVLNDITIVQGDILNFSKLIRTVKENEIDQIIHLTALMVTDAADDPLMALEINCKGFNYILEVARIIGIKRVVWASSVAVYNTSKYYNEKPVNEDCATIPTTLYGATKVYGEFLGKYYFETFGVDSIALRFPIVYGPGRIRGRNTVFNHVIEKPVIGESFTLPWGCPEWIDMLYVKDAAKGILLACFAENLRYKTYNMSGIRCSLDNFIKLVRKYVPNADIKFSNAPQKSFYAGSPPIIESNRALEELGFQPEYSLEKGIEEHIAIFRQHAGGHAPRR